MATASLKSTADIFSYFQKTYPQETAALLLTILPSETQSDCRIYQAIRGEDKSIARNRRPFQVIEPT